MKYTMTFQTERGNTGSIEEHKMLLTFQEVVNILNYWLRDGFTIHHLTLKSASETL